MGMTKNAYVALVSICLMFFGVPAVAYAEPVAPLPVCQYEDGNPDGQPCVWTDPDTGTEYDVSSENYREGAPAPAAGQRVYYTESGQWGTIVSVSPQGVHVQLDSEGC